MGIARSFQIPRPFVDMTVFENVLVGSAFGGGSRGQAGYSVASEALEITGLIHLANVPAGQLRLLDRKRLELARALATQPKLILLDEIAGGLTEKELPPLIEMIRGLRDEGVTVVWIEHIVHALLAVVDQLMCLAFGRILAIGDPHEVMASPEVDRGLPRLHLRHGGVGVSLLQVAALDVHYGDFQARLRHRPLVERGRDPCGHRSERRRASRRC